MRLWSYFWITVVTAKTAFNITHNKKTEMCMLNPELDSDYRYCSIYSIIERPLDPV
jgi:hypothetical protein